MVNEMHWTKHHAKQATDICEHLITLWGLVQEVDAKLVIELGVHTAQSTVALLEAVHASDGRLVSVDIDLLPHVIGMLNAYKLLDRWQFNLMDDIKFGQKWPSGKKADLIFIDTSHTFDHTTKEIELYEPILRPGGIMAFHDTVTFRDGVLVPIENFLKANPGYKFVNHAYCNGLGIMRKPA